MWLVSLRDLQWRRRRFLIAVVATRTFRDRNKDVWG
jgi:hypothetical protein